MGGIINKGRLEELRQEIAALRARPHNIKSKELISLAKSLGRVKAKRGKHLIYVSTLMPTRNPLVIPGHRTLKSGTAGQIMDELSADIDGIAVLLDEQEQKHDNKRLPSGAVHKSTPTR
jgi:hypothetical protein